MQDPVEAKQKNNIQEPFETHYEIHRHINQDILGHHDHSRHHH